MKNRYFSFRLYKEGLANLALPGLITGGILLAAVILQGWSEIVHALSRQTDFSDWAWTPPIFDAWSPVLIYMWVAPFLFGILLFNFLNNRKKSDYYHALPVRREALFISFGTAIYTWLIATVISTATLATILFITAGAEVTATQIGTAILGFSSAAFYMAALTMLAMTLTGTLFSNIVLGNLFLWIPLLVSMLFSEGVSALVPALPFGEESFFGLSLGLTPFSFTEIVVDARATTAVDQLASGIVADTLWTSFLALIMLGLATFFFARRKSETAGNSAPSKRMQALYRVAVALPPLMTAALFTSIEFTTFSPMTVAEHVFAIAGSITIALIMVCAFELISTKTWRNLLKVPLSFGIALVLAGIFTASIWAVAVYEANFTPRAENIVWVSIPNDVSSRGSTGHRIAPSGVRTNVEWRGNRNIRIIWEDELRVSNDDLSRAIAQALVEVRNDTDWLPGASVAGALEVPYPDTRTVCFYPYDPFPISPEGRYRTETIIFEVRTISGMTKRRTLSYGTTDLDTNIFTPNQLGEALANLDLR